MKEKIDLSLNRSLEELLASYWEAENSELDLDDEIYNAFYALEDYLCDMDMEDGGEITTEYLSFENDEEYELFLNSDDDTPENILYN